MSSTWPPSSHWLPLLSALLIKPLAFIYYDLLLMSYVVFYSSRQYICNAERNLSGRVLPWWLLLCADWLTFGKEERGGSLRVGVGARLLDRSSLGWKFPTAYTPCIQVHTEENAAERLAQRVMLWPMCNHTTQIVLADFIQSRHLNQIKTGLIDGGITVQSWSETWRKWAAEHVWLPLNSITWLEKIFF